MYTETSTVEALQSLLSGFYEGKKNYMGRNLPNSTTEMPIL